MIIAHSVTTGWHAFRTSSGRLTASLRVKTLALQDQRRRLVSFTAGAFQHGCIGNCISKYRNYHFGFSPCRHSVVEQLENRVAHRELLRTPVLPSFITAHDDQAYRQSFGPNHAA